MVSDHFLASGGFLRWVAGGRKDHYPCHSRGSLSSVGCPSPAPDPVPIFSGSRGLSAPVWSLSKHIFTITLVLPPQRPSSLLAPRPGLPAQRPRQSSYTAPSRMPLIPQQTMCPLCSAVVSSREGAMSSSLSCMTHFISSRDMLTCCKCACFARKAEELILIL